MRNSKKQILSFISGNGGFDNFRNWNHSEKTKWIMNYFNCSKPLAEKVAFEI